jgi:hypothetical protein
MRKCAGWTSALAFGIVALGAAWPAGAQQDQQELATIEQRASGAERVVVATVEDVTSAYETNEFGDRLIVSHAKLHVEEAIKGPAAPLTLSYEGGTVNGVTLHVSSLGALEPGERAVFFVSRGRKGEFQPHLRGQGIVKLDRQNHVPNSSLTLDDIRRMARGRNR